MEKDVLLNEINKYIDKIFFYCAKRCNSVDDASDLSQSIFLEIVNAINSNRKIENLDFYVWAIAKNQYTKYQKGVIKDKRYLNLDEDINSYQDDTYISKLDEMIQDEKIRIINTELKLLKKDYVQILWAYYIEDKTLKTISEETSLPLGTVKRKLFEVRNKLKENVKMERIAGKKAFVPKEFNSTRSGGGYINPNSCVSPLINQNLLIHSYDNPCSLEDYSLEMGISLPYIKDIVKRLENATLLTKTKDGKYLTNFAILEKELNEKILQEIKKHSSEYASLLVDFCKKHFNDFKSLVNNCDLDDNKIMWTFMFIVNRTVEYLGLTKDEAYEFNVKFTHQDEGGGWNFSMYEVYEQMLPSYRISECLFGNGVVGVQGVCWPGGTYDDSFECEALKCLEWENAGNWDCDYELFGYLLNHKDLKYSECDYSLKKAVDYSIKENYLFIDDDKIKFNFVLMNFDAANKYLEKYDYHIDLIEAKKKKCEILTKLKNIFKTYIPDYLEGELNYLATGYFCGNIRQYVVKEFVKAGLIKPIFNGKRFVHNMYAWERK